MARWIRFLIVLILGFGIGLLYGWVISPVKYVDTSPESLREDYQVDYVLMVAEAFQADRQLALAKQRLAFLGIQSPVGVVEQAMFFAVQSGYSPTDLSYLRTLSDALLAELTQGGETSP